MIFLRMKINRSLRGAEKRSVRVRVFPKKNRRSRAGEIRGNAVSVSSGYEVQDLRLRRREAAQKASANAHASSPNAEGSGTVEVNVTVPVASIVPLAYCAK